MADLLHPDVGYSVPPGAAVTTPLIPRAPRDHNAAIDGHLDAINKCAVDFDTQYKKGASAINRWLGPEDRDPYDHISRRYSKSKLETLADIDHGYGADPVAHLVDDDGFGPPVANEESMTWMSRQLHFLTVADVFDWSPEIMKSVAASAEGLPPDAPYDKTWLYSPDMFWWLGERDSHMHGVSRLTGVAAPFCALHIYHDDKVNSTFVWGLTMRHGEQTPGPCPIQFGIIHGGETLAEHDAKITQQTRNFVDHVRAGRTPAADARLWLAQLFDDLPEPARKEAVEALLAGSNELYEQTVSRMGKFVAGSSLVRVGLAGSLWLKQKVVLTEQRSPSRMAAKRAARKGRKAPSVQVIVLRRQRKVASEISEKAAAEAERKHIEWSCQWMVRGFWRQQWYATEGVHRPKWIAPFIKGPADKPLRHVEKVFAVVR